MKEGKSIMASNHHQKDHEKMWMELVLASLLVALVISFGIKVFDTTMDFKEESIAMEEHNEEENEDCYGKVEGKVKGPEEEKESKSEREVITLGRYPIMGKSEVTAKDLVEYFQSSGKEYPKEILAKGGADTIEAFSTIYIEEACAERVRPEVAFVQSMKETGFLQYGGDAKAEQFNFAGLGTTGNHVPGNAFPDVRTGIRAQIQHLKAYATTEQLNQECVDERYEYVKKGSAPYVEWLGKYENPEGQGWATAEHYGDSIVEMIQNMKG